MELYKGVDRTEWQNSVQKPYSGLAALLLPALLRSGWWHRRAPAAYSAWFLGLFSPWQCWGRQGWKAPVLPEFESTIQSQFHGGSWKPAVTEKLLAKAHYLRGRWQAADSFQRKPHNVQTTYHHLSKDTDQLSHSKLSRSCPPRGWYLQASWTPQHIRAAALLSEAAFTQAAMLPRGNRGPSSHPYALATETWAPETEGQKRQKKWVCKCCQQRGRLP